MANDSIPTQGVIEGYSVLIKALNSNNFNIALSLINKGAKDSIIATGENEGVSALWMSTYKGYKCPEVQSILAYLVAEKLIANGLSALWLSIDQQYLDVVFKLLDFGAVDCIPTAPEFRGFSVLLKTLLAAYKENDESTKKHYLTFAKILVERGAIDNIIETGTSPLFLALTMNKTEIVDSLLERWAKDTMILTGPLKGETVISLAIEMEKYHVILKLLMHNISGENKDILHALFQFSEKVIKCLLSLQINGQDDPIFDQLKRYACPILIYRADASV